jgi:hypothetical protein
MGCPSPPRSPRFQVPDHTRECESDPDIEWECESDLDIDVDLGCDEPPLDSDAFECTETL